VTAPIERPQNPIVDIPSRFHKYSTTTSKSSYSYQPNETYDPSLCPLPEKSKLNTQISGSRVVTTGKASYLEL